MPHSRHSIPAMRVGRSVLFALTLVAPGIALSYDTSDAMRDCENRIRTEYGLIDLRETRAVQLMDSDKHYQVEGKTKINGDKYRWSCEISRRRVVDTNYRGPRPDYDRGPPPRFDNDRDRYRDRDDDRRGPPEIIKRGSGEIEVRVPINCTLLYDRRGNLLGSGGRCSPGERRRADDAASGYFRQRRDEWRDRHDERRFDGPPPRRFNDWSR